jgi:hypothetical protein
VHDCWAKPEDVRKVDDAVTVEASTYGMYYCMATDDAYLFLPSVLRQVVSFRYAVYFSETFSGPVHALEQEHAFDLDVKIALVSAFDQESYLCWIANRWESSLPR